MGAQDFSQISGFIRNEFNNTGSNMRSTNASPHVDSQSGSPIVHSNKGQGDLSSNFALKKQGTTVTKKKKFKASKTKVINDSADDHVTVTIKTKNMKNKSISVASKKTSSLYVSDTNPYGFDRLQASKKNYVIEGPQEGQIAKRMRINSQINQADVYAITEHSMGI